MNFFHKIKVRVLPTEKDNVKCYEFIIPLLKKGFNSLELSNSSADLLQLEHKSISEIFHNEVYGKIVAGLNSIINIISIITKINTKENILIGKIIEDMLKDIDVPIDKELKENETVFDKAIELEQSKQNIEFDILNRITISGDGENVFALNYLLNKGGKE